MRELKPRAGKSIFFPMSLLLAVVTWTQSASALLQGRPTIGTIVQGIQQEMELIGSLSLSVQQAKDALIEFTSPSLWASHSEAVIVAIVVFATQSLLIAILLMDRRRRRASRTLLAADALRESEPVKLSLLESIQNSAAVIDQKGIVLEANRHWLDEIARHSVPFQSTATIGANYFDICRKEVNGEEIIGGFRSVLHGDRELFEIEYESDSSGERQWYRMTVQRLPPAEGHAVVTHLNITQKKLAEMEEKRLQQELIFLNRSSEMGQLAASLAHELAQPMAAALSNAQAALRLATLPKPDINEVRAALVDIVEDGQRARDVLNSIRSILKKQSVTPHPVCLNEIVDSVTVIVKANAQMRGVKIRSVPHTDTILIQGDEVPLQQVLLNLINNAIDAMDHLPIESRILTLKTSVNANNGSALLAVEDNGHGIPDDLKDRLFSPFFTTKSDGLGMGLAICRSILQTLGGSIACQNRPGGGAIFHVELRLAH